MSRNLTRLVLVLPLLLTALPAQSFNVDVGTATGAGAGAPAAAFGGAASRPGTWNNFTGTGMGPLALVDLGGAATGVTLARNNGAGGTFAFNNASTTGDFELLLDDGQDVGGAGGTRTYTFTGLAAGNYTVYTYAVAPDSATFTTNVSTTGSPSTNPQTIGGAIPVNAFAVGITHSVHVVNVAAGATLVVTCATASGFGTINGFQICNNYIFTLSQSGPGGPLDFRNSCGEPGSVYFNVGTLVAGSFPAGPLFGIEMTIAEALVLISLGPPFTGVLDANGQALFSLAGLPPGITIYYVGATVGALTGTVIITPAASYTSI